MRRICAVFLCLATVFALFSCRARYDSSRSVIEAYVLESKDGGRIYGSAADEASLEYMSPELAMIMFGTAELPSDFTILVNSRLDTVTELGVFRVESRDEGLRVTELASERVALLRTLSSGDGEVTVECNLVIYYFGADKNEIKKTLLRILD